MDKWEYPEVYIDGSEFAVISSGGIHLTDAEYKSLDPKGKIKDENQLVWQAGIGKTRFKMKLLNRLGMDGWEVVGNINTGQYYDVYLLLKRPIVE